MGKIFKEKNIQKGFTLVEIVIMVTVIVVFSLIIYAQIEQRGIARTRDAKRVSDLNTLKTALQLYYMDKGYYPTSTRTDSEFCSIEASEGVCASFAQKFSQELEPYLKEIPGDPRYPDTEGLLKTYSYQYKTMAFGQDYKIHSDLETEETYEVYSGRGDMIVYEPPGGEPPPRPGIPPNLITYFAEYQGGYDWKLSGEIISTGLPGKGIIERGFEWSSTSKGPYLGEWTVTGEFGAGYFENILNEFPADPGYCQHYYYRAKAKDIDGDWGYGNCVGGDYLTCEFVQCYLIVARFVEPTIYEGTEGQMDPINIYVERVGGLSQEVTVNWGPGVGTAISDYDYTTFGPNPLVFPPGVTSTYFSVRIIDDFLFEDNETTTFELYETSENATTTEPVVATLTIHDNEIAPPMPPVVITSLAFPIGSLGATLNGNITSLGSSNVTERGFEWRKLIGGATTSWTETPGPYPTGSYPRPISGLSSKTIYRYRAKAKNSSGWGYGLEQTFTTL